MGELTDTLDQDILRHYPGATTVEALPEPVRRALRHFRAVVLAAEVEGPVYARYGLLCVPNHGEAVPGVPLPSGDRPYWSVCFAGMSANALSPTLALEEATSLLIPRALEAVRWTPGLVSCHTARVEAAHRIHLLRDDFRERALKTAGAYEGAGWESAAGSLHAVAQALLETPPAGRLPAWAPDFFDAYRAHLARTVKG